ncbi:MAG: TetR/AcrR family transcriptional regulator [Novosphingobium sp.]
MQGSQKRATETGSGFDPFAPLPLPDPSAGGKDGARRNQRLRRATILAITRQLLAENGCEGVTVREIARRSGFALQTIYNLVGPRDHAITDAISEYSLFVGRVASRQPGTDPLRRLVDTWMEAVQASPEFARQCNMIMFTPSRHIYYRFRDIQIRGMTKLLRIEKKEGRLAQHSSPRKLAEQLVFYSTAVWVDWADRPGPIPELRERLLWGLLKLQRE